MFHLLDLMDIPTKLFVYIINGRMYGHAGTLYICTIWKIEESTP